MGLGPAYKVLLRPIMFSTVSAMAGSYLIFMIGTWFGASMLVEIEGEVQELNPWAVSFTAGFVVLFGGLIAIGLLSFVPRSGFVFGVTSMVVFGIFLFGPINLTVDTGTLVTLVCVHVAVLAPTLILIVPTMLAPPDLETIF